MHLFIGFILFVKLATASEDLKIQPLIVPPDLTEDRKVFLTCQTIRGERPLTYQWMFNGKPLHQDDNVHVQNHDEDLSILTINRLKYKNIGNYSCHVSNRFRSDSSSALIEFKGKPIWWLIFQLCNSPDLCPIPTSSQTILAKWTERSNGTAGKGGGFELRYRWLA